MIRVLLALLKIISMGVVKGGAVKIVIYLTEMLDKLKGREPNAQCTPPNSANYKKSINRIKLMHSPKITKLTNKITNFIVQNNNLQV